MATSDSTFPSSPPLPPSTTPYQSSPLPRTFPQPRQGPPPSTEFLTSIPDTQEFTTGRLPQGEASSVPLTCIGQSRPVTHVSFSALQEDGSYYMISGCKDNYPILRNGMTGDWIGTFIGHKGAVWQARLSPEGDQAITASADYTVKVWNCSTGQQLYTIKHDHVVRTVAYAPDNFGLIATGGMDNKVRLFNMDLTSEPAAPDSLGANTQGTVIHAANGREVGVGIHTASIKAIVWTQDAQTIITASGNTLRWFDTRLDCLIHSEILDGEIKTCELALVSAGAPHFLNVDGTLSVLAVAAGSWVYFYGGAQAIKDLKRFDAGFPVSSVALNLQDGKIVVGEDDPRTWARVFRWDDNNQLETLKGHHGPVRSIAFSPDGKLYATASEDGTIKLWKNFRGDYGLWQDRARAVSLVDQASTPDY